MSRYLIADFIVEMNPKYNALKMLCEPFLYSGNIQPDIVLNVDDTLISATRKRMKENTSIDEAEEFCTSTLFNRAIIKHGAMLIHSSAIVCDGKAFLFSAASGVGKSTHTKLWLKKFGDRVHILNDDKPIVKIKNGLPFCCGTPFDGGSGIAKNETVPLGAVIFIERAADNYVTVPDTNEIVKKLYQSTAKFVGKEDAACMLENFDRLIKCCKFYILHCNTDISSVQTAYDALIAD